jgi:hypothetical protein
LGKRRKKGKERKEKKMVDDDVIFYGFPEDEWGNGIILSEYRGAYYLGSANRGRNKVVYKHFCYPQQRKRKTRPPAKKAVPWQIKLGSNKEEAVKVAIWLYKQLKEMK